jgi:hypothetical protein
MTNMPNRMPNRSETQPISGSIARPGMAHHAAIENPTDRARAGIASDRVAKRPGSRMASTVVSTMFAITVSTMFGASAKHATNAEQLNATPRSSRKISAGSRRNSRVPSLAPTARPRNWKGSATAAR